MRKAGQRGEELGLTEADVVFYDSLEVNDSAVAFLGDEALQLIAQELVMAVKSNIKIDWANRKTVRAQMRVNVKRIIRKYGYPPDKKEKTTLTVIRQAEVLCR